MNTVYAIVIFIITFFFYLHIKYNYQTSNDLEIYNINEVSKDKFEEICDLKQPMIMPFHINSDKLNKEYLLMQYGNFNLNIINKNDDANAPLYLNSCNKLFLNDKTQNYYTENNIDFLQETCIDKILQYYDSFFRPTLVSECNYDIIYGSHNTYIPLRHEINYRNILYLHNGTCDIMLSPPKSKKYLHAINDHFNMNFISKVNPWDVQDCYLADVDKIKFLNISLEKNKILIIPPYWWYSIKLKKDTELYFFKYNTYTNNISNLPYLIRHILQKLNTKIKYNKILSDTSNSYDESTKDQDNDTESKTESNHESKTEQQQQPHPQSQLQQTDTTI